MIYILCAVGVFLLLFLIGHFTGFGEIPQRQKTPEELQEMRENAADLYYLNTLSEDHPLQLIRHDFTYAFYSKTMEPIGEETMVRFKALTRMSRKSTEQSLSADIERQIGRCEQELLGDAKPHTQANR